MQIDWEYPDTQAEQQALVDLLRLCREGLDELARNKGKPGQHYEVSVCKRTERCLRFTDTPGLDRCSLRFPRLRKIDDPGA